MDAFTYQGGELRCESVPVRELAAEYGTPLYVYSRAALRDRLKAITAAFAPADPLVCFSVKSCGNLGVLNILRDAGAGFDVVTGGELHRALRAGADPRKIVYAGVGKTDVEIRAGLKAGILMFNVESEAELTNISQIALEMRKTASVALRVNPDVDAPETHRYTSTGTLEKKFGIDLATAARLLSRADEFTGVAFDGIHCHIGSPVLKTDPYEQALSKATAFMREHRSARTPLGTLNMGGGFAIRYKDETVPTPENYAAALLPIVQRADVKLIMEPGRFIAGNSGILVVSVQYIKDNGFKRFVITDGGMNDLIRPALYGSYHELWPVVAEQGPPSWHGEAAADGLTVVDVVGPVCESGDFFAQDRPLPEVKRGDLLAVFSAGAYGHVMSSNYNGRPRPAEVVVAGERSYLTRRRETYDDLTAGESIPPELEELAGL